MSESVDDLDFEEIKERVKRAIFTLAQKDNALFSPLGKERNITQRFSFWLQAEFPDWDVDTEYQQILDGTSKTTKEKAADLGKRRYNGKIIYNHRNVTHMM